MQFVFKKKAVEKERATRASFHVANLLAKKGKPFTDGELIKKCLNEVAKEMCPENVDLFSAISLSANTVARRVEHIERNIKSQLKDKASKFVCFSVALDESIDVSDTSQLLLFIRGINANFEITEELVSVHSMHGTTTGIDIFREVEKSVAEYNLEWKKLKCITTDGGRNMCGTKKGLVGQINKVIENSGGLKPLVLHCILHQQALCGKHLDLSSVLDPVISTVNYIRSHGLKHRQFRDFLEEMNAEFPDLPYYTSVRWLSYGKILARFFELRTEIEIFLNEKNHSQVLLKDSEWLWKLAFSADLTMHLNDFNLRIQGETSLICDLYSKVKAFRKKLILFESQLTRSCFTHFSRCDKYRQEAATPFPNLFAQDVILALKQQFEERFSDLDACSSKLRIFENPFNSVIGDLPSELQMEVIDLQSNDILKDKYKEGNLIEFYKCLPSDQFLHLRRFACEFISVFGTTYLCEKTFSKMKYTKSCYRSQLSDEHLNALLVIGTTHFEPQLDKILSEMKQFHVSPIDQS
ncbi:transcription factor II-I repeat domain-containing 2-like [Octopus vulgaris]|uniref:Transcription factor II-I repeat domain-containing 2-like n=1 Tax=Octopus vulgaris TaxID=6645 RepID=A0AA36BMY6_OCTVU|nr:transcription factor II-I repeat domain-containing 2-like [Octopus vulgaris]CAI9719315.1 transcription factor II-I repeat domain-containing 2-like [Octopus vulgaris]CAI9736502.1 transcription factor II-I repeat domain-containing 2-like [Octopus vulgaris]